MKTMQQWHEAKTDFTNFVNEGEEVCEEICDYFIETLPPITMNSTMIQMGEAYDHFGKMVVQGI